jgi:hypothetical protein
MITKSVLYEIDSFSIGNYTYITDFTEPTSYAYKWLKSGPNCLIMTAEADNNNIVTSASYFTSSGLVNSKSINNEEDFYLYPNPVNEGNEIMLFLNNNNSKIVKIFDSSGRELFHNKIGEGITKVDLSTQSYEAGLYYLTVYNDNHTQAVLKFSVVK